MNGKVVLIADVNADEVIDANDVTPGRSSPATRACGRAALLVRARRLVPNPAVVMLRDGSTIRIPSPAPNHRTCGQ